MPMINEKQPLKTQEEQVEFINRFADIVKDNGKLRNNYKISLRALRMMLLSLI